VPYGVGFDEPRASNNSIAGRQSNRRVEFYIIPEKQTVEMAKSGKL
jgi:flagellar motor protein MotB